MNSSTILNKTFIEVDETSRIYNFADKSIKYDGVKSIHVSASGTHYLNLTNGTKVIVAPNWLTIDIVVDNWSF